MRIPVLSLFAFTCAFSQPFSFGLKAGVPLTDFVDAASSGQFNFTSTTNRYIVGPTVELRLPAGFGVEFDALYRRLHYNGTTLGVDTFSSARTTGNLWEFPLLLKYRFHAPLVRPYLDAGVAWQTLTGLTQNVTTFVASGGFVSNSSTSNPPELRQNLTTGFVVGGGLDIHLLVIHVSPEIRYTRWGAQNLRDALGLLQSNQNQAEFLVGITF